MKSRQFARGFSNFNPRSPDGERPRTFSTTIYEVMISIHAPRMGSDRSSTVGGSPRQLFQSTLPGWGATCPACIGVCLRGNFNPRSPDGERRGDGNQPTVATAISIHAPRMGSDSSVPACLASSFNFNPRSPDGERPRKWTSSPTIWAKSSIFNTDCIADRH